MGRHLGVFSCTMLMYLPFPTLVAIFPHHVVIKNWSYHRHRHILHAIVYPWIRRIRRCISDALGCWLFTLILRAFHLARIWFDVSALRRGEGLPRGRISPSKIPCNCYFCCERHHPWVYCEQLHREPFCNYIIHHVTLLRFLPTSIFFDFHER